MNSSMKFKKFNFDFSSLEFKDKRHMKEEAREIPKLNLGPVMYEYAEEFVNRLEAGRNYIAFLAGTFVFGDFIESIIREKYVNPEEVYITTLGMNENNVDSIVNILRYLGCEKLHLIVSHYFAGVEKNGLMQYMLKEFNGLPVTVSVLQSHCKICLIRSGDHAISITGSANLSSSNNVEQITLIDDAGTYDYLKGKLDIIVNRFCVIDGTGERILWERNRDNTAKRAYNVLKNDDIPTEKGGF